MWQSPEGHQSLATHPVVIKMPPPRSLAVYVAGKVVRHARNIKNIHEDKMWCLDCKLLPEEPVTGRCGHTRCSMCIKRNGACLCGAPQPEILHSNILVRDIIQKMMSNRSFSRVGIKSSMNALTSSSESERSLMPTFSTGRIRKHALLSRLHRKQLRFHLSQTGQKDTSLRYMVASPQLRFEFARELRTVGRHRDAAAHLAHVAASTEPIARLARDLLAQVINVLSPFRDPRRLTRALCQSVRQQSITACIDPTSIECPVCYNVMEQPVTTTCGHTFCRCCIKRTLEDRNMCPLCSTSLRDFYLAQTENTEFVCAVLGNVATQTQVDPDFIPLLACIVAFPYMSCPLMIFDRDFRNVIRGVLDSGSRRFGMLASVGDDTYTNFGTIVEVRDCVMFEDGRSILSTVGISRFRVLKKITINGCPYARIEEHTDIIPVAASTIHLQLLAHQISSKVQQWLPSLDTALRSDIETYFGPFPELNLEGEWWDNPNGPIWLWWLIAILPLRTEIQMLMISTKDLSKRMTAVQRTLDAMDYYKYTYRIL